VRKLWSCKRSPTKPRRDSPRLSTATPRLAVKTTDHHAAHTKPDTFARSAHPHHMSWPNNPRIPNDGEHVGTDRLGH
jgi:hypothetical protein